MTDLAIYADGDDQVLEGRLGDVVATLRRLPSMTDYMLGMVIGVALSRMIPDQNFHSQAIDALGPGAVDEKLVRVNLSLIPGKGWGLRFVEDQPLRIIE